MVELGMVMIIGSASTRRRGFTLVELIAVMVVLGVMATIPAGVVRQLAEANNATAIRTQMFNEASMAMDRIVSMIKFTPVRAAAPQTPALSSVSATAIAWENGDALSLSGTTLSLCSVRDGDTAGNLRPLVSNVSALAITPLNDAGANLLTTHATSTLNAVQRGRCIR